MSPRKILLILTCLGCSLAACAPAISTSGGASSPLPAPGTPPAALSSQSPNPRASATPEPKQPVEGSRSVQPPGIAEMNRFTLQLSQALESRDFKTLDALMSAHFLLAEWQGDRQDLSHREADQALRSGPLTEGSHPAVFLRQDVAALLGGSDPLVLLDPKGNNVRAFALSGLGPNAESQAVALIAVDPTKGKLYWRGLIVAQKAFPRTPVAAYPPDFTSARAKTDLDLRAGPSAETSLLGQVPAGTLLEVFAKSVDGAWLEVLCTQEISGHCWVPADPSLVEPVTNNP